MLPKPLQKPSWPRRNALPGRLLTFLIPSPSVLLRHSLWRERPTATSSRSLFLMLQPSTLSVRTGRVLSRSTMFLVLESTPFLWQLAQTTSAISLFEVPTSKSVMPLWYWASGLLKRKSNPLRQRPLPRIRLHLPPPPPYPTTIVLAAAFLLYPATRTIYRTPHRQGSYGRT